jgi:transposase-like protein
MSSRSVAEDAVAPRSPLPLRRSSPTAYSEDLIAEIVALAEEGYSVVEVAAHWSIDEALIDIWREEHPEFDAALRRARTFEKAWWMSRARHALRDDNNRFPAGAWSHVMRARFPEYDDKKGVTVQLDLGQLVRVVMPDATTVPRAPRCRSSNSGTAADVPSIALPGPDDLDDADPPGGGW